MLASHNVPSWGKYFKAVVNKSQVVLKNFLEQKIKKNNKKKKTVAQTQLQNNLFTFFHRPSTLNETSNTEHQ